MINVYLNDSITVKTTTFDQWGTASESSMVVRGRIEFRTKLVRSISGEQVVSTAKLYLSLMALSHKDKIVYDGKEYSILNIEQKKDFSSRFLEVNLA